MSNPLTALGKYQPLDEIGSGGFAVVYRALDTVLEREVALKVLRPKFLGDPEFVERFFREARTVARLDHPGIIRIFDVDSDDGRAYIAMELAAGSLAGRGPLPWGETLALLRPICEALDYAHQASLVHRDLKPANILLSRRGHPLISDFGFARATGEGASSLSVSGGVLGTPGYIAPEIWDGQVAGPPADRYALACIAYEILTGKPLFQADTPARAVRAHIVEGPHFPATWPAGVPPAVAEVLAQALRREPEKRFKSAMAFWDALTGLTAATRAEPAELPPVDVEALPETIVPPETIAPPPQLPDEQGDSSAPRRSLFAQLGGAQGCTIAVMLALLLVLGGLGGFRLLGVATPAASATAGVVSPEPATATSAPAPTDVSPTDIAPTSAPPTALPSIQAAPTAPRVWSPEPPEQGRVLEGGGAGAVFVAVSRDKAVNAGLAYEPPSCLEGLVIAPDGSRLRHFRVELVRGAEVRRADHDHLTGTYATCGLDPGDWEVSIVEYLGVAASAAERAGHAVRFHTSGTPGEIFYISFQASDQLPPPAAPLYPPPVSNPRPAETYDGYWDGTLSGISPYGPATGHLRFEVADGRVVYTESFGAPCTWVDPDLRATIADGISFAGLAVSTGVYYDLAGVFDSPTTASGTLRADVGPGQPCLDETTWTARRVSP